MKVDRARRKIRNVVSSFNAFGSSWKQMVLGINGWPHWPVITSCYHANEMAVSSKERRKRGEWRICERLLVTQLNLRSSRTRSDVTPWWDWPGPDINCRPSGSLVDGWSTIQIGDGMILCYRRILFISSCHPLLVFHYFRIIVLDFFFNSFIFKIFEIKDCVW